MGVLHPCFQPPGVVASITAYLAGSHVGLPWMFIDRLQESLEMTGCEQACYKTRRLVHCTGCLLRGDAPDCRIHQTNCTRAFLSRRLPAPNITALHPLHSLEICLTLC